MPSRFLLSGFFLALVLTHAPSSASEIEERLAALQSKGIPALIEVGTDSCPPCRAMKPVLKRLSEEYRGKLEVVSVDVAEDRDFAHRRGVRSLPTQIFVDGSGKEFKRHFGFIPYEELKGLLEQAGL